MKYGAVPNTIASTLKVINQLLFPNITYLLTLVAVLPITTCEAERSISTLRRLKTYTVDREIFAIKIFRRLLRRRKLNARNILCNVCRPIPSSVA